MTAMQWPRSEHLLGLSSITFYFYGQRRFYSNECSLEWIWKNSVWIVRHCSGYSLLAYLTDALLLLSNTQKENNHIHNRPSLLRLFLFIVSAEFVPHQRKLPMNSQVSWEMTRSHDSTDETWFRESLWLVSYQCDHMIKTDTHWSLYW